MRSRAAHTLSLFLLLALCVPAAAQAPKREEQLEAYRQELGERKRRLERVLRKEGSLLKELDRISRKVHRLDDELGRLEGEQSGVRRRVEETSAEIDRLERGIRSSRADVSRRLRDLYIWGGRPLRRAVLSSRDAVEARRRRWFLRRWIERDRERIETYRLAVAALAGRRERLGADGSALGRLIGEANRRRSELEEEKSLRSLVLAMVRDEKGIHRKSIQELEEAARGLQRLVESLRGAGREGEGLFARMKGKLPLPVRGTLEKRFGAYLDPKLRMKLHHKGIDLRAEKGAPIRAVFDAKVVFADWFVGYGRILILEHDGGFFTLYAHADRLLKSAGDSVTAGETIAHVGESGSLKGAYLYFELRQKGISQDPWPWFAAGSPAAKP